MAKRGNRSLHLSPSMGVNCFAGCTYEAILESVGIDRVIESVGIDRVIDLVGEKEVIKRIGLDRWLANLSAAERREVKRRLR